MSYSLKNYKLMIGALAIATVMCMSHNAFAQVMEPIPDNTGVNDVQNDAQPSGSQAGQEDLSFLDEETSSAQNGNNQAADAGDNAAATEEDDDENDESIPAPEVAKTPFEKFGNAILSRVDSDLFNQMADIEKQTTLLNLELKREDLKNKVEALKVARAKARDEERMRKLQEEEKLKELENERKAKIIQEQQKLKEKEIELEKIRQAKVLNDYMNEMLLNNQKWIEKNAALQNKVKELEEGRLQLLSNFENMLHALQKKIGTVHRKANEAVFTHNSVVKALNSQINNLNASITENQNQIRQMEDDKNNPFSVSDSLGLDEDAIDMSQEYAIMDITGKGKDIIAKIVSKDGTTFMVHKGSMLKGGEVVTAITDHYIAFDNKGIKSFLYTGGTVLDFEPTKSFNSSAESDNENVSVKSAKLSSDKKDSKNDSDKKTKSISSRNGMFVK